MKSAKLDQRIRIDSKQVTTDANYGTQTVTWATFATVWAWVQDVLPSKAESQSNGLLLSKRPARIRIRYLAGITTDMRVVLLDRGNRVLQIVSGPAELGRKEGIEIMAEQYTTDAT
ncbi:MAG: phage head closure protein [Hyphomicrobium sp.]|jgi:SPP1 family predicted phage head-tail adaptor